jgi:diacylglycerol O-acyltransferase / wax synthase
VGASTPRRGRRRLTTRRPEPDAAGRRRRTARPAPPAGDSSGSYDSDVAASHLDHPGPATEPLSPEDATLLCATPPEAQLQIGALCRFEGEPLRDPDGRLRFDDLHTHVAGRLAHIPRFRQRIHRVPLDLARPVWVDDTDFDLDRHLRRATLPAPGGADELRRFVGDLLGQPLDTAHPLWDLWLIDGLDDGQGGDVAVVLRAHHVVADGLSLLRAAIALLDVEPTPPPTPPAAPWKPRATPGPAWLALEGIAGRTRRQVEVAAGAARTVLDPRQLVGLVRSTAATLLAPPRPAPRVPLVGRVASRRDFLWTSIDLGPLHEAARRLDAKVNDLVLAAVTGAVREVVGPATAATLVSNPPKVLVPVGDTSANGTGNSFSFVVTGLPVHLDDPVEVIGSIHSAMEQRKSSGQSDEMRSLFSAVDVVPVGILRLIAPEVLARQPFVNLAVTNVPGSPDPLYLRGARLVEMHPIITGVGNIAAIIGVLSYCDELGVGLTVDPDVVSDPDHLLGALRDSFDAVVAAGG